MNFKTPPPLKPGDTIGVMAPSSRIARADIESAKAFVESKGYKVFIHPQTYLQADAEPATQYAGTVEEKINALHDLVKDSSIKAIFFASGGQRSLTLLDHIDYALIEKNPKIYMGFSDSTALVNAIAAKAKLITYHGPTFKRLSGNPQIDFNLGILSDTEKNIPLKDAKYLNNGQADGYLFGGNLSIIRTLLDSDLPCTDGGILFLEEIGEELTTIDRDLCALKRRGIFDRIGGLVLGQFTNIQDTGTPFGMTLEDVVKEHTKGLNIPVVMNAPFGHEKETNYILPIGARAVLKDSQIILQD